MPPTAPFAGKTASILLVDDHRLMLDCLGPLITDRIEGTEIVGTTEDATSAISLAKELQPTLVVMDIDLPGVGCFEAANLIRKSSPETLVLYLSGHRRDEYIEKALEVGACGYALKSDDIDALIDGIRRVLNGEAYYSPSVLDRVRLGPNDEIQLDNPPRTRLAALTERERQVFILLAQGESVKRIASFLDIAYKTVDKHKVSLMKKLDIHDRVELCRFAVRERIIEP